MAGWYLAPLLSGHRNKDQDCCQSILNPPNRNRIWRSSRHFPTVGGRCLWFPFETAPAHELFPTNWKMNFVEQMTGFNLMCSMSGIKFNWSLKRRFKSEWLPFLFLAYQQRAVSFFTTNSSISDFWQMWNMNFVVNTDSCVLTQSLCFFLAPTWLEMAIFCREASFGAPHRPSFNFQFSKLLLNQDIFLKNCKMNFVEKIPSFNLMYNLTRY